MVHDSYSHTQEHLYSLFSSTSSWYSFYHDRHYHTGSGDTIGSQRLALWYRNKFTSWTLETLNGTLPETLQQHYGCTDEELLQALEHIKRFCADVEQQFGDVNNA